MPQLVLQVGAQLPCDAEDETLALDGKPVRIFVQREQCQRRFRPHRDWERRLLRSLMVMRGCPWQTIQIRGSRL